MSAELALAVPETTGEPPVQDLHPYRAAILLGLVVVAVGLLWTMVVYPAIAHDFHWIMGDDVWAPYAAGRYVSAGAFPYLYSGNANWVAGPLLPTLLAPLALLDDGLKMTSRNGVVFFTPASGGPAQGFSVAHPSIWPYYAVYGMGMCITLLIAVRALLHRLWEHLGLGDPGRLGIALQLAITATAFPLLVIYYGHYEDVLLLAFVCAAFRATLDNRWTRAGLFFGLAIVSKQWGLLFLPLFFPSVPKSERVRFLALSLLMPAVLYAIPFAADPHARRALLHALAGPWLGHPIPWLAGSMTAVSGSPYRGAWVVFALVVGWFVRKRRDPESLLAAAAIVLAARLAFEPVLFGYYLAGPICFLGILEAIQRRSVLRTAILGLGVQLWWYVGGNETVWWIGLLALVTVFVWPAIRTLRRSGPDRAAKLALVTAGV